jgi:hypothetical protein
MDARLKPCVLLIYKTIGWELRCDKHLFAEATVLNSKRWILPSAIDHPWSHC